MVDSSELLQRASKALFEHTKQPNVDDYPAAGLQVVGLDCEWLPYNSKEPETPVAVLQVVTRTEAYLIDMLYWARPWGGEMVDGETSDASPSSSGTSFERFTELTEKEREINAFLTELFTSDSIIRVGFMFGFDVFRLQRSYPHLPAFKPVGAGPGQNSLFVVEILAVARFVLPQVPKYAISLAKLVNLVIDVSLDKTQQLSNWAQRPLTSDQIRYAADDGHTVVAMLDMLAAKKPDALARLPAFAMQEHRPAPPAGSKAWLWPAAPTTGDIALDLEGVVRAHLGALVVANGQPTRKVVAELIGHGGVKLQVDQEGLLVWKNTGMMFVTLGARKAKLARSGQQLHTMVQKQQQQRTRGSDEDMSQERLLFCRANGKPYQFCGRCLEATSQPDDSVIAWELKDYDDLRSLEGFQQLVPAMA